MKWQFWRWLFIGLSSRPGYTQFTNAWLVVHIAVGVGLARVITVPVFEAAQIVLLPLAGILIGLSFAWAGNAQALLQKSEIERVAEYHPDGLLTYVFTFQLAILIILITLSAWGLAGLKFFHAPVLQHASIQFGIEATLYFLASLTLRECWHVVVGSQLLILSRHEARKHIDRG